MIELTKSLKRKLQEQSMRAHKEELRRALAPLAAAFDQWRQGQIDSGSLALQVHDWDRGPARELSKKYNSGLIEFNVAHAIVTGVLDEQAVPPEVLECVARHLAFYRERLREESRGPNQPSASGPPTAPQ